MPTREELHKLIDSLPEGAMEVAYQALSHFQVWPPPLPPQIEELRQGHEKRLKELQEAHDGRSAECQLAAELWTGSKIKGHH